MILETARMGQLEVSDEELLHFDQGLPGFENLRRFALLEIEEGLPYKWLQAVEDAEISLLVADPFVFYPEYDLQLSEQAQQELKITDASMAEVWSVVTLASELKDATINLLAPIVLNREERLAKQLILHDNNYQTKHPLIRIPLGEAASDREEG